MEGTTNRDGMKLTDRECRELAMRLAIHCVSRGEWDKDDDSTKRQASLWMDGVRDGRISDVTIQAADWLREIGRAF